MFRDYILAEVAAIQVQIEILLAASVTLHFQDRVIVIQNQ